MELFLPSCQASSFQLALSPALLLKDDITNASNQQGGILLEPNKNITLNPLGQALINCAGALSTLSGSSTKSANL